MSSIEGTSGASMSCWRRGAAILAMPKDGSCRSYIGTMSKCIQQAVVSGDFLKTGSEGIVGNQKEPLRTVFTR